MTPSLPMPECVRATFRRLYEVDPEAAVRYLHDLGTASGYIRTGDMTHALCWTSVSLYGTLECTINLSKPEKDPRTITAAVKKPEPSEMETAHAVGEPQCDLCWENEGFVGTPEHPAKPGLRIAAIELGGERWGLQYSPYAYFTEHCIVLCEKHRPMKVDTACFGRLIDFVDAFPFYFIGSNADLPIVGGSILSHDHYQGGRHVFPLMKAPIEHEFRLASESEVHCGIVRWPASVIRLESKDRYALKRVASKVLDAWRNFADDACGIVPLDADGQHSTLNPIVYASKCGYVMDLVLRNNLVDVWHPWGLFHPDESLHHIKKENIGLIEIMGLAILPSRLARELPAVQSELIEAARCGRIVQELNKRLSEQPLCAPHAVWAMDVYARRAGELRNEGGDGLHPVILEEVSLVFASVLEATGVFKRTPQGKAGWRAFIDVLNRLA